MKVLFAVNSISTLSFNNCLTVCPYEVYTLKTKKNKYIEILKVFIIISWVVSEHLKCGSSNRQNVEIGQENKLVMAVS